MRNDSLLALLAIGASISWVFFICVGSAVFTIGIGIAMAVGTSLLTSAARKLLARPSVNL